VKCVICSKDTEIGKAYFLPALVRDEQGNVVNLVACSDECKVKWESVDRSLAENADVWKELGKETDEK
jgi:hypothetical protein